MPDASTLALFVAASLALVVPPGPAVLYIVARSIDQGRLAGVAATFGIGVGTLFHIAAAAFGISAILVSSALLFDAVRFLGAAYLVVLGVRKLLEEGGPAEAKIQAEGLGRVFRQGIVVNLLNPKTALFFLAFLPQFADPAKGGMAAQILILGGLFVVIGFLSDVVWAMLAGTMRPWIRGNERYMTAQRRFTGSVYVGLGVLTALQGANRQ